jgi:uncharacterized protein
MASEPGPARPLAIAALTTVLAAALSRLPNDWSAAAVGLAFLAMTYRMVLRHDDVDLIRRYGLALGGVFEPERLSARRLLRDALGALGWALGVALLVFPAFWLGFVWWWRVKTPFHPARLPALGDDLLGQLCVIALPEEAFYRGYLQSALDDIYKPKLRVFGAEIGPGLLIASAIFAIGHLLTEWDPNRLAVFFPALLFGWLRARTKGIGASVVLHALCNLFASYLGASYGLGR